MTVLIARSDGKDLDVTQVKALIVYIVEVVMENNNAQEHKYRELGFRSGGGEKDLECSEPLKKARQAFREKYLNPDAFEKYFNEFKQKKLSKGDLTWTNATPPARGN